MVRQPLIRFRYAIQKAAATAGKDVTAASTTAAPKKVPAPPGVIRTSQRIEKMIPRAALSKTEMEAIMLGGAL